jgi:hypothetical protein
MFNDRFHYIVLQTISENSNFEFIDRVVLEQRQLFYFFISIHFIH